MPRLDISSLESSVQYYYSRGLAESTKRSYRSAQTRYLTFCGEFRVNEPLPLVENVLCAYVSKLANDGLKHQSIKSYLSALRFMQISAGLSDPYASSVWPRLQYVLKGVKRPRGEQSSKPRLPITPDILRRIQTVWQRRFAERDTIMLWASFCIGFFGFLRAGEFTVPGDRTFDPGVHLCVRDIALDSHTSPTLVRVTIKASKIPISPGRIPFYRSHIKRAMPCGSNSSVPSSASGNTRTSVHVCGRTIPHPPEIGGAAPIGTGPGRD